MPKPEKIEAVRLLREALAQARNFYLLEFAGLTVAQMTRLREAILQAGGRLHVCKNTLLRLALREVGVDGQLEEALAGPTALVVCYEDPVEPARAVLDFIRAQTGFTLRLKGGYVEGRSLDAAQAEAVAKLPSKLEIQSGVVGAVSGPLRALVGVLNAAVAELVYVLSAVADKRRAQEAGQ
jgi:large subunit ribosomal protein L10